LTVENEPVAEEGKAMRRDVLVLSLLAAMPVCLVQAQAQSQTQPQTEGQSQSPADAYRGMFVCEKAPGSADILNVPADLAVRGDQVQFARPLFNPRGTRVLGSELAAGSKDASGTVHLTSTWNIRGITVHGDYKGTLTPSSGTLTGTQSWRGQDGEAHTRICHAALVLAANANQQQ
jgi:hypothetical protein